MAGPARLICGSDALRDGARGVRFELDYFGETTSAFVVRYCGEVHGYLNRCSHVAMELDWREGEFFDSDATHLICSTHGALYRADTGDCAGGPCGSRPLVKLRVEERDGYVYLLGICDD